MAALIRICDSTPIVSYGNGGFTFGGAAHRGSVLVLGSGVFAWQASSAAGLDAGELLSLIQGEPAGDFLLLGTGAAQTFPAPAFAAALDAARLGLEVMATAPACRTFNLLIAERRHFTAALIAV